MVVWLAALMVACSNDARVDIHTVEVGLEEWGVHLSEAVITTPEVDLAVTNAGILQHEVVILRTDEPADGLRTVNGIIDLSGIDGTLVGEVADLSPGQHVDADIGLAPGRYVLFCNVPGHYDSGMHAVLTVRAGDVGG